MISSNISHLGDRLFYNFLNRSGKNQGARPGYNLGIMADYLQKKGYQKFGVALSSAHKLLQIHPNEMNQESEKIHNTLNQGLPQLFLYGCKEHSIGLNLVPDLSSKFILCEIFNSGAGLSKYHEHHELDFRKYKTMLQIKVPIDSLNPEKIKTILLCDNFTNVDEAYRHIFDLSSPLEIIKSESTPWQTQQKEGECDLRWILAYLKNKMPEEKYKKMLLELKEDCSEAYKKKNSYADQAWRKQTKKFPNGVFYEGSFKGSKFHGEGKLFFSNNNYYQGNFMDDCFHGHGKRVFPNGNSFEGEFTNGAFVSNNLFQKINYLFLSFQYDKIL
jgi:hypothetical protein